MVEQRQGPPVAMAPIPGTIDFNGTARFAKRDRGETDSRGPHDGHRRLAYDRGCPEPVPEPVPRCFAATHSVSNAEPAGLAGNGHRQALRPLAAQCFPGSWYPWYPERNRRAGDWNRGPHARMDRGRSERYRCREARTTHTIVRI